MQRTLAQIMESQMALAHPDCLDHDFDDMLAEESMFYENPMTEEEMEVF